MLSKMFAQFRAEPLLSLILLSAFLPFAYTLPYSPNDLFNRDASFTIPLNILPLGDSITWGFQAGLGTNGYRKQLLDRLTSAGADVDFVGTQTSGDMVDNQNEGHPGFTIKGLHDVMGPALDLKPNLVLLHIGTNDFHIQETPEEPWSGAPQRLGALLDAVLDKRPDAVVMVAQIIPSKDTAQNERIKVYNNAVPAIVEERRSKGNKVFVVDHRSVRLDELGDDVHPNDAGYTHMGNIWYEAIAAVGEGLISAPA